MVPLLLWRLLPLLLAATLITFVAGFFFFLHSVPFHPKISYPSYTLDAVVVFTGDRNRLKAGFSLLQSQRVQRLFITGVSPSLNLSQVVNASSTLTPPSPSQISCCVTLDKHARNTIQNVQQTLLWTHSQKISDILLVTSDYHIPRSLLIFQLLNSPLKIHTFPVSSPPLYHKGNINSQKILTLLQEYGKITFTLLTLPFQS